MMTILSIRESAPSSMHRCICLAVPFAQYLNLCGVLFFFFPFFFSLFSSSFLKKQVQRAQKVVKMAKGIKANLRMLAEVEAADVGKSTHDAEMAISGAASEGEHWCLYASTLDAEQDVSVGLTAAGDALPLDVVYRRDPIGVVGLISAWNYPINVAFRKVAPALIAGNSVVLKPSELGGLAVMFLAQLADDAGIPKGVFNVVMGDRDAGQTLAAHQDVAMISFTGSSATGSKIMQSCAPRLAQNMLELGGKALPPPAF